jgi:hypothetical protein
MKNCLVLLMMGCGTVAATRAEPDAGSGVDAAQPDSLPPVTRTAIAADAVTTFAALDQTFTHVPFASVAYDDAHGLAPDTSHFVAPHDGDYELCASLAGPTIDFELDVFVNGTRDQAFAHGTFVASGCRIAHLATGDVAEVMVWQNSGSSQSFGGNPFADWLTIAEHPAGIEVRGFASLQAPQATFVRVPYVNKLRDPDDEYDPVAAQFTPKQAGDYEVCASLGPGGTLDFELDLFKNNIRERGFVQGRAGGTGCRVIRLAATDHLDVRAYQDTLGSATIPSDPSWTWLSIARAPSQISVGDTASFTLPSQTFMTVPYASMLYGDARFDPSTHIFSADHGGDYEVCASMVNIGGQPFELDAFRNSQRYKTLGVAQEAEVARGCRVVRLAANDTLDVRAFQQTGAALAVPPNVFWNWLTVREIP